MKKVIWLLFVLFLPLNCQAFELYSEYAILYNPEFDSFRRTKSPHPLFYKGLERFFLLKKMRTMNVI